VDVLSFRSRAGKIHGRATVDGKLACEATLTCAVVARERERKADGDASLTAGAPAGGAAAAEGVTEAVPVSTTVSE
jgi:3-hydroxyacyl-[acyl-carrier-protein] dehydratase